MLNTTVIDKYNSLFFEVAEYYKIRHFVVAYPVNKMNILLLDKLGFKSDIMTALPRHSVYTFLNFNYKLFVPFFRFFYESREENVDKERCIRHMNEMNDIVRRIRSQKKKESES